MYNNVLKPMVYRLKVGKNNMHHLEEASVCFEVNGKDYGSITNRVKHFYNAYNKTIGSMGVMLTGNPGTGKTRLAEKLCNECINQGLPVVIVTDIKTSINTINYIAMLRNVVVLFDEFGKNFNRDLQDKMLSMLSGVSSGKKLFILTENNVNMISNFIVNRPGRVKYHIDFDRLEEAILQGYCVDHYINKETYAKIFKLYEKTPSFSFDHLQAIVAEVNDYPNDNFEEILLRLNLSLLRPKEYVMLDKVLNKDNEVIKLMCRDKPLKQEFLMFARLYVNGNLPVKEDPNNPKPQGGFQPQGEYVNLTVSKDNIIEILDNGYVCKDGDYTVYLTII